MATTQQPAPSTWRVTSQQEGQGLGPAGTYTKGVFVYFALDSGEQGSVFVPAAQYTTDNVRQLVQARADQMREISGLAG